MNGPSLVAWGGGDVRGARWRQAEGALVVAWEGADARPLARAGVAFRPLEEVLGSEGLAAADAAGRGFARVWARLALREGRSFRELVDWRGESLLWACEGFLRAHTAAPHAARGAELCLRLVETLAPREVDALGLAEADVVLLARACTACGVLFHGEPPAAKAPVGRRADGPPRALGSWLGRLARAAAMPAAGPDAPPLLLALVPGRDEGAALAPLLAAVSADLWLRTTILDAAGRERFSSAASRAAASEAVARLRATHAALAGTPALAASYVQRGVGFAELATGDLDLLLLRRLPELVRGLETTFAALEALRPALVLVVEPEHDARRALGLAAAAAGVPWATLRLEAGADEEPDRADAGPRPAAMLVLARGTDPRSLLAPLREAARGRVGAP